MTIIDFLEARLAEDEAVVHEAETWFRQEYGDRAPTTTYVAWDEHPLGAVISDPGRAMREVKAKRAVVAYAAENAANIDGEWGCGHLVEQIAAEDTGAYSSCDGVAALRQLLSPLAAVYSDHPDFDPSWAE